MPASPTHGGYTASMPSPFPGMDPYLEGDMWQEFHETLAGAIRARLMRVLPRTYVALLAKRYVVDRTGLSILDIPVERVVYPDVHVVGTAARQPGSQGEPSTAVATAEPAVELPSPLPEEVPLLSVEVRDVAQRRLVTAIEILSPVNKQGDGAREYAERRATLLETQTHLLELDLLRRGTRIQLGGTPPPAHYYIYLSRSQRRPWTGVWPVGLRERLPPVPVPLLSPDPDVPLDVQAAVDDCFALVGYERLLAYADPPPPTLAPEDAEWVDTVLRAAGRR
jgi:hypothetical protein